MGSSGRVTYARKDDLWVLRFEGQIRYLLAPSVSRFIDRMFAEGVPGGVCVDLRETLAIDSTGIGLLAKIANDMQDAGRGRPVLVSTNPEISELLVSLCLDEVCILSSQAPDTVADAVLPFTSPSERELARVVLDAHQQLSQLSDENRETFRSVVEAIAREVDDAAPDK